MTKYRVLDLFAGAGGMSLGFIESGHYEIAVAIESNPHARATYQQNHPGTHLLSDVRDITDFDAFRDTYGRFDVIIGGPPCQGFSNANRQNHNLVNQNNRLVKKYVEFIIELEPTAFVMENVTMLKSSTHRFYLSREDQEAVLSWNLPLRRDTMHLFRGECPVRDVTAHLTNQDVLRELVLPRPIYDVLHKSLKNVERPEKRANTLRKTSSRLWTQMASLIGRPHRPADYGRIEDDFLTDFLAYVQGRTSFEALNGKLATYCALQQMWMSSLELLDNGIVIGGLTVDASGISAQVESYPVLEYIKRRLRPRYHISDGILNAARFGAPQLRDRYIMIGIHKDRVKIAVPEILPQEEFTEDQYRTVKDAIGDLESVPPHSDVKGAPIALPPIACPNRLAESLRDAPMLHNHVATATRPTALRRFAVLGPGQNFHDLAPDFVRDTYTLPERTQNTIYMRLNYAKPSGTVLNVRKSMWIHPVLDRAISVREAARLQTFPDSFIFVGPKDAQYQQIGNAVPPVLARAIAAKLATVLPDKCSEPRCEEVDSHARQFEPPTAPQNDVEYTVQKHAT